MFKEFYNINKIKKESHNEPLRAIRNEIMKFPVDALLSVLSKMPDHEKGDLNKFDINNFVGLPKQFLASAITLNSDNPEQILDYLNKNFQPEQEQKSFELFDE